MLENNQRDPTHSTLSRVAQALQIPVGLLFISASEKEDLGPIDEKTAGKMVQCLHASLTKPTKRNRTIG